MTFSLSTPLPLNSFNQQLWLTATPKLANNHTANVDGDVQIVVQVFYTDHKVYEKDLNENKKQQSHDRHVSCKDQVRGLVVDLHSEAREVECC